MGFEHVIPQFVLRMKEIIKNNKSKKIDFKIQGNGNETRSFCFIDDFTEGFSGNNYCFNWAWYLSNDFQMFLTAPIIIFVML